MNILSQQTDKQHFFYITMNKRALTGNVSIAIIFFIIINAVFIQMPLSGSLTGNNDTWANLSMFKDMGNHIANIFQHNQLASSNYPCNNIWPLYGLDFFSGIIFLFFKLFHLSDLWAYHLYISTIYALNSFAIYKLCRLYSASKFGCFLAGFFFSISNFVLANIDNPNIVLSFPGFLALYYLIGSLRNNSIGKFSAFILLSNLQFLMAPITAVMFFFIMAPYILFHCRKLFFLFRGNWIQVIPIALFLCSLIPYIYYYIILKIPTSEFNATRGVSVATNISMSLDDFCRTLPGNIFFQTENDQWISMIKSGYTGIALVSVAAIGAWPFRRTRYPLFIFLAGFFLSMGPYISIYSHPLFPSPLLIVYKLIPLSDYLRIPSRFFILGIAGLVILFSVGWERLMRSNNKSVRTLAYVIPILYIGENLPFPLKKYSSHKVFENGSKTNDFIRRSKYKNVLNLPSKLFDGQDYREYVYMYYQTINRINTINGSLAYFPKIRLQNDTLCRRIEQEGSLEKLVNNNSIDLVIFHSDLADTSENVELQTLKTSLLLKPIDTSGEEKIFAVVK